MRVPLSWLREYVDIDLEPARLAERLTVLGMEVKGLEQIGADWERIVVGELLEVTPAAGTDHLLMTRVRTADGEPILSVLTGASNVAAGQRVPVAVPGSVLPGGRRIEVTRIAGIESQGMLCSGDELRMTTDADGILILPGDVPVGSLMADLYGDWVLDVDVKPNRGDCLSLVGLAREVAAISGGHVRWPEIRVEEAGSPVESHLAVEVMDPVLCARFVGRYADGFRVKPSPLAVQARLMAAGMRPVSNVVDASNYVMLEIGKPIHTFDAAAVTDGRIIVRLAASGERIETLDHIMRDLTPDTLLIADARGPIGIAGVMGGAGSEVGDATTAVVIESAVFDPVSVRRTAQRYALRSEASLRFEKGQEHRLARLGADRTAQLILEWGGGQVARGRIDTAPVEPGRSRLPFRPARVSRLLGIDLGPAEMRHLLERVEVVTEPAEAGAAVPIAAGSLPLVLDAPRAKEALVALIPTHRRDLEIEADIAEEVARVRGYDTITGSLPHTPMPEYRPDPRRTVDAIRDLLAGRGLAEVVTHALVGPHDHERLGIAASDPATIRVTNPIAVDHSQMRRSMLPGLLAVLVENERQRRPDVAIFEVGSTHEVRGGEPREMPVLGMLMAGDLLRASWDQPPRSADFSDVLGLVAWLCERLGDVRPASERAPDVAPGVEHPGRTAVLRVSVAGSAAPGEAVLGRVFELDPRYVEAVGGRAEHVVVALLATDVLEATAAARRPYVPFTRVPLVERDLAVVVPETRGAGDVETVIRRGAGTLLRDLHLFDVYQGAPLAPGDLSLAFRLVLQASDRTLTDLEVDAVIADVVAALDRDLGVHIRS